MKRVSIFKSVAMGCIAATLLVAADASAQSRMSLADRVAALETRTQQNQSDQSIQQLNRIAQLESDVKSLRALVEQMQNANEENKQSSRAQYIDLDSRLARLEGVPSAALHANAPPPRSAAPAAVAAPPAQAATQGDAKQGDANALVAEAPTTTTPGDPANEQAAYDAALASVRSDQYADSAQRFSAFVQQYPNSTLAPNAYYWMGESYYVTQNYQLALQAFKTVVEHFPDSPKAIGAMLKLGYSQDGLKQREAARATLQEVMQRYPNSDEASQAQSRLRTMDMDAGR